jgi:hypothetical protein
MKAEIAQVSRGMCAEIRSTKDGYIRRLSIREHGIDIIHNRTGETAIRRDDGKIIYIRECDVDVINNAMDRLSRFENSDTRFFKFIDDLFIQYEAIPAEVA